MKSIQLSSKSYHESKSGFNKIKAHSYLQANSFRFRNIQIDKNNENPLKAVLKNQYNDESQSKNSTSMHSYGQLPKIKHQEIFSALYKSKTTIIKENNKLLYNDKNTNVNANSKTLRNFTGKKINKNHSGIFSLSKFLTFKKKLLSKEMYKKESNRAYYLDKDKTLRNRINAEKRKSMLSSSSVFDEQRNKQYSSCLNLERKQMMIAREEKDKKKKAKNKTTNCFLQLMYPYNILKAIKGMSKQGRSETKMPKINQDAFLIMNQVNDFADFNVFGVFDGHGLNGHLVSEFVKNYFKQDILTHKDICKLSSIEEIFKKLKEEDYYIIREMFRTANTELHLMNFDVNFSGTTCVIIFHIGYHLICANVGDSRAIMVELLENTKNQYQIIPLSYDHKPQINRERKRIEKAGGKVDQYSGMFYLFILLIRRGYQGGSISCLDKERNLSRSCNE